MRYIDTHVNINYLFAMLKLFEDQEKFVNDLFYEYQCGRQNVFGQAATGFGKTVVFSHILRNLDTFAIAIAHRKELISQISLALARNEVHHDIVAPDNVVRQCGQINVDVCDHTFISKQSKIKVASIDTLINRNEPWFSKIRYWVIDEGHHVVKGNKWHKGIVKFEAALGLLLSATPIRADGLGLGRHADGIADSLVLATPMRELIDMGRLCDYRIFSPESDIDLTNLPIGKDGDYVQRALSEAGRKSHIVGDTVDHYMQFAEGKRGLTFCIDVDAAHRQAAAYRLRGIRAEVVTANTPDLERYNIGKKFKKGEIQQLVNVGIFGEGYDVPGVEVVVMAKPTQSYAEYAQQFGRVCRIMAGKPYGMIIDQVGNVRRHGLPDALDRVWSLDRREKATKAKSDEIKTTRVCPACVSEYSRLIGPVCPYCGHNALPAVRNNIKIVDGVLTELSPETLAKMRNEVSALRDKPLSIPYHVDPIVRLSMLKNHNRRLDSLSKLEHVIARWAYGKNDIERAQREFYLTFGIDVLSALTLKRADADNLAEAVWKKIKHS